MASLRQFSSSYDLTTARDLDRELREDGLTDGRTALLPQHSKFLLRNISVHTLITMMLKLGSFFISGTRGRQAGEDYVDITLAPGF